MKWKYKEAECINYLKSLYNCLNYMVVAEALQVGMEVS
jgi:hypothetical protein